MSFESPRNPDEFTQRSWPAAGFPYASSNSYISVILSFPFAGAEAPRGFGVQMIPAGIPSAVPVMEIYSPLIGFGGWM
ncbi:hypothetical protein DSECCO2_657670 [anaerobic digester metagenome]